MYKQNSTQCKFNCNPKMHQILSRVTLYSAALLIGSQFYESWWREEALKKSICSCEIEEIKFSETEIQVILLRYCMHLIPGIGAGIWICTPKVFFHRFHRGHPKGLWKNLSIFFLFSALSHAPGSNESTGTKIFKKKSIKLVKVGLKGS